ncbi:carbohydrate sulfotransferase 1 [Hydra vulgaris]|uniref:Carbohydrate sulfotransferase 1 n=1 Tax=Hydra vulgaris TaxID=6087 RepID=T2MII2_HYDVU|nr:carbohydrate sulfotransferase 1 [Hydra vulgaris]
METSNIALAVRQIRDVLLWVVLFFTVLYLFVLNVNSNGGGFIEVNKPSEKLLCQSVRKLQERDNSLSNTNISLLLEVQELRQKVAMYERLNRLLEFNSWMSQHGSKTRQNILILSSEYCGSSLLGELFNQNPQIFYLYEPLKALDYYKDNRPSDVYDSMVTNQIDGIFQCKFDDLSYYTNYMSFQYSSLKSRLASRALSTPPLCPEANARSFYSIRMCTPLKPKTTSAICKLHQHTVIKTIQFSDVHKLSYLMDKDGTDYLLKVVHLVRDPRAIVFSHFQRNFSSSNFSISLKEYSTKLCSQMLQNIKYAITAPPWLQGKYTLLRYEDLGTNPHQIAELVYKFAGVPIVSQVRMWLDKLADGGATQRPTQFGSSTSGSVEEFNARNLTQSVHNWRTQLQYKTVRAIETECYEVMNLLGYKIVDDEEELTTLNLSLVD